MPLTAQFRSKNGETVAKSSQYENYLVSTLKAQTRVQIPLGPPTFSSRVSASLSGLFLSGALLIRLGG